MFDRIEMDVIDVPSEVVLVANGVLPETALPQCKLAAPVAPDGAFGSEHAVAEQRLDQSPSARVVGIVWRECQYGMEVIRKHHNRVDAERALMPRSPKGAPQHAHVIDK